MTEAPPVLLDPAIHTVISLSRLAAFVLAVPSGEIVVASPSGLAMFGPDAAIAVGRPMADFMEGGFRDGLSVLQSGEVTGYETHRVFARSGVRRRFWIRTISDAGPVPFVLVVVLNEVEDGPAPWRLARSDDSLHVYGAINGRLIVDRISVGVERSLGHRAADIAGTSLFLLIDDGDVAAVLLALARLAAGQESISMRVRAICADQTRVLCRLLLVAMVPAPSCTFALLPSLGDRGEDGEVLPGLVERLVAESDGPGISEVPPRRPAAVQDPLPELTQRERELVSRLLAGDRVPAIASALYLSQGTVRNQLSTLYGKLGVNSQQELIALLRP